MKHFKLLFSFILILSLSNCVYYYKLYGKKSPDKGPFNQSIPTNNKKTILVFNKTTAHRHEDAIENATIMFKQLGQELNLNVIVTENAAVFNAQHLARIDVIIWNNSSGRLLLNEQREDFKQYMINGGSFLGIHQAGDASHHWKWYKEELIGAKFSHHNTTANKIENGNIILDTTNPIGTLTKGLKEKHIRKDEWYVYRTNPRDNGANVIYTVDENTIDPYAHIPIISYGSFGMGDDHPVAWCRKLTNGKGKSYFSPMGHTGSTFEDPNQIQMFKNAIEWLLE